MSDDLEEAQAALDRMQRAHSRGTGCHLTADMIRTLAVTFLGQVWAEPHPRDKPPRDPGFRVIQNKDESNDA